MANRLDMGRRGFLKIAAMTGATMCTEPALIVKQNWFEKILGSLI